MEPGNLAIPEENLAIPEENLAIPKENSQGLDEGY